MTKKKVLIALSGGVDSSVACWLLKKEGYDVEAAFMKNWDETLAPDFYRTSETGCSTKADQEDARAVAKQLGIKFHIFNFTREYYKYVIENFFAEYRAGRTPNPDVLCNKFIKFGLFLEKAKKLGFNYIATGHYARISSRVIPDSIGNPEKKQKEFLLLKGLDSAKDQSYFLWTLTQDQLKYCLFPIGDYQKSEIRKVAKKQQLLTAKKPDSQGICFVGEVDVEGFLKSELGTKKGDIITTDGKKIGEHEGHYLFTVGQRHGIQVGGGTPYYVVSKNAKTNTVIAALGSEHPALYQKQLHVDNVSWTLDKKPALPLKVSAKIRYRQPDQRCTVVNQAGGLMVMFDVPQRAVTPGQSIVFYDKNECLGGGIIE